MRGGSILGANGHPLDAAGASPAPRSIIRTCRGCGCTDNNACVTEITQEQAIGMGLPAMTRQVACCWVLLDIETPTGVCSVCANELGWHPVHMVMVGREEEPELIAAAGVGGFR